MIVSESVMHHWKWCTEGDALRVMYQGWFRRRLRPDQTRDINLADLNLELAFYFSFALIIFCLMVCISYCPFTRKSFYSLLNVWQIDHRKVKLFRVQGKTDVKTQQSLCNIVSRSITKDTFSWSWQLNYRCWHCVGHITMTKPNLYRVKISTKSQRNVFFKSTMGVPTNMISSTEEKGRLVTSP